MLLILIIAIEAIQNQIHPGSTITGRSLRKDTPTNRISARESSLTPNALLLLVILATVPSTMSLNPHSRYIAVNEGELVGRNSRNTLPIIRNVVRKFAIYFFILCHPDSKTGTAEKTAVPV